jgi:hypothetical protein
MKTIRTSMYCVAVAAMCGIMAYGAAAVPAESMSTAKMESRTKDKSRDPGIFGDYWWANRFLSRHKLVEQQRGKTVDLVLLGDSVRHGAKVPGSSFFREGDGGCQKLFLF